MVELKNLENWWNYIRYRWENSICSKGNIIWIVKDEVWLNKISRKKYSRSKPIRFFLFLCRRWLELRVKWLYVASTWCSILGSGGGGDLDADVRVTLESGTRNLMIGRLFPRDIDGNIDKSRGDSVDTIWYKVVKEIQ